MDLDQDQEVEVPNKKLRSHSTELSPGVDNSIESEAISSGPQTCLFCGKVSKSEQELRRHMYYYHKERNCKHCGDVFSGTHFLIAHVSKHHTQVVQCEDCGQVWITKKDYFPFAFPCLNGIWVLTAFDLPEALIYHFGTEITLESGIIIKRSFWESSGI